MISRKAEKYVREALGRQPAVALIGPRQVGKTTLALEIGRERPSVYLDLQRDADRAKLADPEFYFGSHADKLIILDEIHQAPDLFRSIRGRIDLDRREGRRTGRFLILGSASIDLMKQSGETLAGRIAFVELSPVAADELVGTSIPLPALWVRGGFPESLLAATDADSLAWRHDFVRTYLERDVPQFNPRVPAESLMRFWTMLAHTHGSLLNSSGLARSLSASPQTISRYIDLLADLLLVRRLPPHHANLGKRLIKSPKVYVRDTGILHALLGLRDLDALLAHPVVGASWEGFVIETLLAAAPAGTSASFFRTSNGAEVDLLLTLPGGPLWAIEIKAGSAPKLERGFHEAREDLRPTRSLAVYRGTERYPITDGIQAIGVEELAAELRAIT